MNFADNGFRELSSLSSLDALSEELQVFLPPKNEDVSVIITVPARNEGERLSDLFNSLLHQARELGVLKQIEVLILANGCTDDTTAVCEKFKYNNPDFPLYWLDLNVDQIQNVGSARRVVMNIGNERLIRDNGVIAMTDADTLPEKGWLRSLFNFVVSDIDLLCGVIEVDYKGLPDQTIALLEAKKAYIYYASRLKSLLYPEPEDPWPRHGYNSGPNMAIKKEVYNKIGGMPPLSSLEDIALYDLVKAAGFRVKHCVDSIVVTSSRLKARVEHGFANELRFWSSVDINTYSFKVEDLPKLTARFLGSKMIKDYYTSGNKHLISRIARHLYMSISDLNELLSAHKNYQSCERALEYKLEKNKRWNLKFPNKDIFSVNLELKQFFMGMENEVLMENSLSGENEKLSFAGA